MDYEMVGDGISHENFQNDISKKEYRVEYWEKHGELPTMRI